MAFTYIFKRIEKKYMLTQEQYDYIIERITPHMHPDRFGETVIRNIYFDNTDAYEGGGELVFGQLVGEVNVYVPAQWKIRTFTTGFLGEVDVEPSDCEKDKILYIKGSRTVGQINVHRR